LELVSTMVKKFKLRTRVLIVGNNEPSEWSPWVTFPSESYVELAGIGPIKRNDIVWLEIANVEYRKRGRLVPDEEISHLDEIVEMLQREGVVWEAPLAEATRISLK